MCTVACPTIDWKQKTHCACSDSETKVRNYQKLRNSIEALAELEPVSQSEARILGWGMCRSQLYIRRDGAGLRHLFLSAGSEQLQSLVSTEQGIEILYLESERSD